LDLMLDELSALQTDIEITIVQFER
jgi:hypothetical protein